MVDHQGEGDDVAGVQVGGGRGALLDIQLRLDDFDGLGIGERAAAPIEDRGVDQISAGRTDVDGQISRPGGDPDDEIVIGIGEVVGGIDDAAEVEGHDLPDQGWSGEGTAERDVGAVGGSQLDAEEEQAGGEGVGQDDGGGALLQASAEFVGDGFADGEVGQGGVKLAAGRIGFRGRDDALGEAERGQIGGDAGRITVGVSAFVGIVGIRRAVIQRRVAQVGGVGQGDVVGDGIVDPRLVGDGAGLSERQRVPGEGQGGRGAGVQRGGHASGVGERAGHVAQPGWDDIDDAQVKGISRGSGGMVDHQGEGDDVAGVQVGGGRGALLDIQLRLDQIDRGCGVDRAAPVIGQAGAVGQQIAGSVGGDVLGASHDLDHDDVIGVGDAIGRIGDRAARGEIEGDGLSGDAARSAHGQCRAADAAADAHNTAADISQRAGVTPCHARQRIDQPQRAARAFGHGDGHLVGDSLADGEVGRGRVAVGRARAGEGVAFRSGGDALDEAGGQYGHGGRIAAAAGATAVIRHTVERLRGRVDDLLAGEGAGLDDGLIGDGGGAAGGQRGNVNADGRIAGGVARDDAPGGGGDSARHQRRGRRHRVGDDHVEGGGRPGVGDDDGIGDGVTRVGAGGRDGLGDGQARLDQIDGRCAALGADSAAEIGVANLGRVGDVQILRRGQPTVGGHVQDAGDDFDHDGIGGAGDVVGGVGDIAQRPFDPIQHRVGVGIGGGAGLPDRRRGAAEGQVRAQADDAAADQPQYGRPGREVVPDDGGAGQPFAEGDGDLVGDGFTDGQVGVGVGAIAGFGDRGGGDGLGRRRIGDGHAGRIGIEIGVGRPAGIGGAAGAFDAERVVGRKVRAARYARPDDLGGIGDDLPRLDVGGQTRLVAQRAGLGGGEAGIGGGDRAAAFGERGWRDAGRVAERTGHIGQPGRDHVGELHVVGGGIAAGRMADDQREGDHIVRVHIGSGRGGFIDLQRRLDDAGIGRGSRVGQLPTSRVIPTQHGAVVAELAARVGRLIEEDSRIGDNDAVNVAEVRPGRCQIAEVPGDDSAAPADDRVVRARAVITEVGRVDRAQAAGQCRRSGHHAGAVHEGQPRVQRIDDGDVVHRPAGDIHLQCVGDKFADGGRGRDARLGEVRQARREQRHIRARREGYGRRVEMHAAGQRIAEGRGDHGSSVEDRGRRRSQVRGDRAGIGNDGG